jgi:hypothetical protein
MKLSDNEIRDVIRHLEAGKPLPDAYRFLLFDDNRCIRRLGKENGQQTIILKATSDCSGAEWERFNQAIADCIALMAGSRAR